MESSVVVARDLKDQGDSKYILLTGAGRPVYYAVDSWVEDDGTMAFKRDEAVVYVCRKEGTWAVVSRDVINLMTEGSVAEFQSADQKAQEAFFEKMDPEGWKEAQAVAKSGALAEILGGGGHGHGHAAPGMPREDGKPVPGQYL